MSHITTSGPGFPLKYGKKGYANILTGIDLIKADWRHTFRTKRSNDGSERVRNPTAGSRIHLLQFDLNDNILINLAKIYVWEIVSKDPRVKVSNIQITPENANHQVSIIVEFQEIKTGLSSTFEYALSRNT